jgi:putative tryptophan/tyrosine transport system substrate-binding protein
MNRRTFLTGLGAVLAAPLVAEGQQAGRVYRLGYLFEGTRIAPDTPQLKALEESLRELGYVEGRNLVVERRYAAFEYDRLPELVAELLRLKPDVIMAAGNPSVAVLKDATTTVPIVMAYSIDPVGAGLITSLARPGGNITGMSLTTGPEFIAKQY